MFPMVQPGTAMTVKETRAGEVCIIIITGPFFCPIKSFGLNRYAVGHAMPTTHAGPA
jgi:hypothetical protein